MVNSGQWLIVVNGGSTVGIMMIMVIMVVYTVVVI